MIDQWFDIPGYEGKYKINIRGQLLSIGRNKGHRHECSARSCSYIDRGFTINQWTDKIEPVSDK